MAQHTTALAALSVLLLAPSPAAVAQQSDEGSALANQLAGMYRSAAPANVFHKIVEVAAPRLGGLVLYHQVARDDFDSASPMVQKFYVFAPDPRIDGVVTATPFSAVPGTLAPNAESRPQELEVLGPESLQSFPADCALRWRRTAGTDEWVATPASRRCRYQSATLKTVIVPELRYESTVGALAMHEVLKDTRGKPLFPDSGRVSAERVPPTTMQAIVTLSRPREWRLLDPERVLRLEMASGQEVLLELAPQLAPLAVDNIRTLVREAYFDGAAIVRAQDNFVVQWSATDNTRSLGSAKSTLPPEFTRDWPRALPITLLPDADVYAPQTGFLEGFPVAGDGPSGRLWAAHCYATLGVGRDNAPESGNGAELYVVIGHAPRQLDRNITVVGRVVRGMQHLSSLPRGPDPLGMYATAAEHRPIRSLRLLADLPEAERPKLYALRTDSASFRALIEARRNRRDAWYLAPAGRIDVCNVPLPARP